MPGMEIPTPGGTMKKMQFEFTDPAEAAAQQAAQPQGIPPDAGIMPSGAQGQAPMPSGAGGMEQQMPMQQQDPGQMPMLGNMMNQGGPDSSLFSDEDLAGLVSEDPTELEGAQLSDSLMDPGTDPQMQEMIRQRLMQAAGRQMGGF